MVAGISNPACSLARAFLHSLTHSLTHLLIHSLIHSLTHSLTHTLIIKSLSRNGMLLGPVSSFAAQSQETKIDEALEPDTHIVCCRCAKRCETSIPAALDGDIIRKLHCKDCLDYASSGVFMRCELIAPRISAISFQTV